MTLAEVLVKPTERGAGDLTAAYNQMIAPGQWFDVLPVKRDILIGAAGIRASRPSVRLPDAVHIASATMLECRAFVSRDRRMRTPVGMRLVDISPFTLDDIITGQP